MRRYKPIDHGLQALLSLHGEEYVLEKRYVIRFRAWLVERSEAIPHGIRYALTMHDRNNVRTLGYDNAHAVNTRKRRFEPKGQARDHWHQGSRTYEYRFENAAKLLSDFLEQVDLQMNRTH